mmetsp:Transcript_32829/g.48039  ORF Transcript_32829/g.48039 Transcript_32829/m.48039 type:complete len:289 (+) Transcript_32829:174-1040(+)
MEEDGIQEEELLFASKIPCIWTYKGEWAASQRSGMGSCTYQYCNPAEMGAKKLPCAQCSNSQENLGPGPCSCSSLADTWTNVNSGALEEGRRQQVEQVEVTIVPVSFNESRRKSLLRNDVVPSPQHGMIEDVEKHEKLHGFAVGDTLSSDLGSENNAVYSGQWKNDMPEGEGMLLFKNGRRHEGLWQHGQRHGHGVAVAVDGTLREGEWERGRPKEGIGKQWQITYKNGDCYSGEILQCKPSGEGMCKYSNGDIYTGSWEGGLRNGQGLCIFANGESFDGHWMDDHIL